MSQERIQFGVGGGGVFAMRGVDGDAASFEVNGLVVPEEDADFVGEFRVDGDVDGDVCFFDCQLCDILAGEISIVGGAVVDNLELDLLSGSEGPVVDVGVGEFSGGDRLDAGDDDVDVSAVDAFAGGVDGGSRILEDGAVAEAGGGEFDVVGGRICGVLRT